MFAELLENPNHISPADLQRAAKLEFSARVRGSNLSEWQPNSHLPETANMVIGVGSYSPAELELLDEIDGAHDRWSGRWQIYVFDVLRISSSQDLNRWVPGLTNARGTPLVAIRSPNGTTVFPVGLQALRRELEDQGILNATHASATN